MILSLQVGMVAWRLTLYTPQYPAGRDVILIGNDITHQIGSFGPLEDMLFQVSQCCSVSDHHNDMYPKYCELCLCIHSYNGVCVITSDSRHAYWKMYLFLLF